MSIATIEMPKATAFLLTEARRYKVLWGGRDALKSWSLARAALIRGALRPTRFLCCREYLTSIDKSMYQLLVDQIRLLGLSDYYDIEARETHGRPGTSAMGTMFAFAGLHNNSQNLKSYEAFDVTIVEEANNLTRKSWDDLVFTIRRPGSEIWAAFNPELESDEAYQRFVAHPPPADEAIVKHLTWRDNPWASAELAKERERMRLERPGDYHCIWEGYPRSTLDDAIWAEELRRVDGEGRIAKVPYDPSCPVHTFWDLGFGNHTSIWCAQRVGMEWRILKFVEDANKFLAHYVAELQKLGYAWGTDFLPHDGRNNHVNGPSVQRQLESLGRRVEILEQDDPTVGINAAREVFPFCVFDREGCEEGIAHLRRYRWRKNEDGVVTAREPLHDEHSDACEAFRSFGRAQARVIGGSARQRMREAKGAGRRVASGSRGTWMG